MSSIAQRMRGFLNPFIYTTPECFCYWRTEKHIETQLGRHVKKCLLKDSVRIKAREKPIALFDCCHLHFSIKILRDQAHEKHKKRLMTQLVTLNAVTHRLVFSNINSNRSRTVVSYLGNLLSVFFYRTFILDHIIMSINNASRSFRDLLAQS